MTDWFDDDDGDLTMDDLVEAIDAASPGQLIQWAEEFANAGEHAIANTIVAVLENDHGLVLNEDEGDAEDSATFTEDEVLDQLAEAIEADEAKLGRNFTDAELQAKIQFADRYGMVPDTDTASYDADDTEQRRDLMHAMVTEREPEQQAVNPPPEPAVAEGGE